MSTTTRALSIAIQANVPVILEGFPGTGKTSFFNQLAKALQKEPCETVILSIRDPAEVAGWPQITPRGVELVPPAWAKRIQKAGDGIVFFDELNTAPMACQAAALRIVQERVVGEMTLPAKCAVVAAINPPECSAGGEPLAPPLANRFCWLEWRPTADEWAKGMMSGFGKPDITRIPESWETSIPALRTVIASFIGLRKPHLMLDMPKEGAKQGKAWASPRTWDMAARLMAAGEAVSDKLVVETLLAGCVGNGPAVEFLTWKRELNLPEIEAVLAKPKTIALPFDRHDALYTVLAGVSQAVVAHLTPERVIAALTVIGRCTEKRLADVALASAQGLLEAVMIARMAEIPEVDKAIQAGLGGMMELFAAVNKQAV
jgi:hypothetical protein